MDFISEHCDHQEPGGLRWGVKPICQVLSDHGVKIAPATYYEWRDKPASRRDERDRMLAEQIRRVFTKNYRVYGARKIWLTLNREGTPVARCTVERLMRQIGIQGVHRGSKHRTTITDDTNQLPGDLVNRDFAPLAPNRLWVADFTYVSTWAGWVYTAFVVDAYARRILGWATSTTMTTSFVLQALDQAIWVRELENHGDLTGLVAHSDHGAQYTSLRYGLTLTEAGIAPSTGSVGDSYDNALAETIIGLYKIELIKPGKPWRNVDEVEYETARWVNWFNHQRLYEYCGDIPPVECEANYYTGRKARQSVGAP